MIKRLPKTITTCRECPYMHSFGRSPSSRDLVWGCRLLLGTADAHTVEGLTSFDIPERCPLDEATVADFPG